MAKPPRRRRGGAVMEGAVSNRHHGALFRSKSRARFLNQVRGEIAGRISMAATATVT